MDHGTVQDDQQLAGQLSLEVFQELDDLRTFDGPRLKLEIEIPNGDPADDRKLLPVEVKFQHWGFAQVRTRWGFWLKPLSSMKTMIRSSFRAFF